MAEPDPRWRVYLARCADGSLYCGVTTDLARREAAHNGGTASRYTRGRRPVRIVWSEPAASKGDALRREHRVKAMSTAAKRRLAQASSTPAASSRA